MILLLLSLLLCISLCSGTFFQDPFEFSKLVSSATGKYVDSLFASELPKNKAIRPEATIVNLPPVQPHIFETNPQLPDDFYFEHQDSLQCGRHSVNNLLQRQATTRERLDTICAKLHKMLGGMYSYCDSMGNNEIEVLQIALQENGFQIEYPKKGDRIEEMIDNSTTQGFLINSVGSHWFAVNTIGAKYMLLDSMATPKVFVNKTATIEYLNNKIRKHSPVIRVYADASAKEMPPLTMELELTAPAAESEANDQTESDEIPATTESQTGNDSFDDAKDSTEASSDIVVVPKHFAISLQSPEDDSSIVMVDGSDFKDINAPITPQGTEEDSIVMVEPVDSWEK